MKTKILFLLGILTAIGVASVEAMPLYTTNTLTFTGASWNDGGSLDGYFTIQYQGGTPTAVLSLDVTTGNGTSDGFIGYDYIYNVSGQADTVTLLGPWSYVTSISPYAVSAANGTKFYRAVE